MASALDTYAQSSGLTRGADSIYRAPGSSSGLTQYGLTEQMGISKTADSAAGVSAVGQDPYSRGLETMMTGGFTPNDPSYAWRFQQGQQALERSQASKGLLGSGNAAVELQTYGQGMASTEYQAQFQRLMQGATMATGQFDTAMSSLARMMGLSQGAGGLNTQMAAQQFGQKQTLAQEEGIKSGLERMMQGDWGGDAYDIPSWQSSSQPSLYNSMINEAAYGGGGGGGSYSVATQPDFRGVPSGQGWWESSSGTSGTLGGYAGDVGYNWE
jgi:hypothetical protein